MNSLTRIIWAAFGLLQFLLAFSVLSSPIIAITFALGGILLLVAALRRSTVILLVGTGLALLAPVLVGISGVEQFQLVHHLVRWALVGVMIFLWVRFVRPMARPTATTKGGGGQGLGPIS